MSAPTRMSPIDCVDAQDRPIGTVSRGSVLDVGANFRTAHVLVYDHAGCLLLQQLAPHRSRHPGRWGSSVAAYLHSGEDYLEGAVRRAREELGLDVPLRYRGKLPMRDERSLKFVALFTALSDTAEITDPSHIAGLSWWCQTELDETISNGPSAFTPTFLALYGSFGFGP